MNKLSHDLVVEIFDAASSRCQDLIQNVLCLYYYPPCNFSEVLTAPVSICPEECFYVQHTCAPAWEQLEKLFSIFGDEFELINCSYPGKILDPLPHCCVDAGITSTSIPGCRICMQILFSFDRDYRKFRKLQSATYLEYFQGVRIEESEKASSLQKSNPGHLDWELNPGHLHGLCS